MKKNILNIILQLLTLVSFGQTQLLKAYDFNKGGYYLLGIRTEISYGNKLVDSLGNFYTNEIKTLNEFKKEWDFKKPSPLYACGYDYVIHICKDGESLEHFAINFECNLISTDKGYFYFDLKKLTMFKNKFKKAFKSNNEFSTILEAREFRTKILKDTNLIMSPKPEWYEYEGKFNFNYKYKSDELKDFHSKEKIYLTQLTEEIGKVYPNEKFDLKSVGGSNTELYVEARCNKTLSDKFNLYPKSWNKWEAYNIDLKTYWKNRHK